MYNNSHNMHYSLKVKNVEANNIYIFMEHSFILFDFLSDF